MSEGDMQQVAEPGVQCMRSSRSGGGGTFKYCLVIWHPEGSLSVVMMMTYNVI
jgi:hypothetical protein